AAAEPPQIGQTHDPAWGGHSMVIAGGNFVPGKTEFMIWSPTWDEIDKELAAGKEQQAAKSAAARDAEAAIKDPADLQRKAAELESVLLNRLLSYLGTEAPAFPTKPPANSVKWTVLKLDKQFAVIEFPRYLPGKYSDGPAERYFAVLWAGDKENGWSKPRVVNRTEAWFLTDDAATAGGALRVIGSKLGTFHGPGPLVALRAKAGGKPRVCPLQPVYYGHFGNNRYYDWQFVVPADTPPGDYEVWAHNRTGEAHGWSGPLGLKVVKAEPDGRKVIDGGSYGLRGDGQADDTKALQSALDAAGKAAPAVLTLPAGVFRIMETVYIPDRVTVRGQGMHSTIIKSSENPPFRGERKP
ncbi:MAG: glycosyl hydrolase family 28-related protein, partial [Kiritimatiellota bacterium]|nr:glycosyl hydrolase family 28-related protein [Kiritimatiellota bacterium]